MIFINPFAPGYIVDLVFVQDPALLIVKVVARGMPVGWIDHTGSYLSFSCTIQKQTPVLVFLGWIQIFEEIIQWCSNDLLKVILWSK